MAKLLRISEAASLALHVAVIMAKEPAVYVPARELARRLNASEAHVSKVMQRLVRAALVTSTRGPGGGFRLRRAPAEITQLEVYEAVEGALEPSSCMLGKPVCDGDCIFGDYIHRVDADFRTYLAETTLARPDSDKEQAWLSGR
jgi:Rrf2 family protein